jgi:putative tricarboxylic transport membrane protein
MKNILGAAALLTLAAIGPASAFEPQSPECIAPANPGGGWDFTCRQAAKVLFDLKKVGSTIQTTNMAGGGGGAAFATVVGKRNADNNLIIAASTATTTRLAQRQFAGLTATQVRWLGTLGADYGVIAVSADSPIKTLKDFMNIMKIDPTKIAIGGGSAVGGWDHLKVLIAAKSAGMADVKKVKYVAFKGGGEAITQLLGGHLQAFSGDISETIGFIDSGKVRVIAVLSPERLPGKLSSIPTAKEQGIDAVGANWRGFYAPGKMSPEAYAFWSKAVSDLYASPEWKKVMETNGLMPFGMSGDKLESYVFKQIDQIETLSKEIGLLK